jgi:hypothetical protein
MDYRKIITIEPDKMGSRAFVVCGSLFPMFSIIWHQG